MKKLMLICISLVFFAGKSVAQYAGLPPSKADLKHRMSIDAPQLYKKYQSGSNFSGIGKGLVIGGAAAFVIGLATAETETTNTATRTEVSFTGAGGAIAAAGFVCALAGTPLWIIGNTKKKNARNTYLREFGSGAQAPAHPSPYLQLNSSQNGVGLALVF